MTVVAVRDQDPVTTAQVVETYFLEVDGTNPELMRRITEIFNRILDPLYGPQEKALRQIAEARDRKSFLLYEGGETRGVLVFKTEPTNEFKELRVSNSIEIKSLFLDHALENSGRGLASKLFNKLLDELKKIPSPYSGIHVTVSETVKESLNFFKKKGFEIIHTWDGRYKADAKEHLLFRPREIAEVRRIIEDLGEQLARCLARDATYERSNQPPALVYVVESNHLGDIHGFKKLSDGTFVSCSKDNALYKWNVRGEKVRTVSETEPIQQREANWITALEVLSPHHWLSGERNGKVKLWRTNGDYVREFKLKLPKAGHVSLEYNTRRVNCLAKGLDPEKHTFFAGFPTMFDEFNLTEGKTESTTIAHKNDWVYSIHPLTTTSLLAVTGATVDLWNKVDAQWRRQDTLLGEDRAVWIKTADGKRRQRALISVLKQLPSSVPSHFGVADFLGNLKVLDINTKDIVMQWPKAHASKIWAIEPLTQDFLFASSGEDRCIKFWDLRKPLVAYQIADHVGEVTAMLQLNENILLAGTAPANPTMAHGAQIRFYDIRR